ncbi:MAG: hypothetical protein QOE75_624 [Solirubrobacterales bacterium]|jgi:hypothetical protein|nr:hypothetical protein [Solirubrobacterales bacterium]
MLAVLVRPALRAALLAALLALAMSGTALAAPSNDDFVAALIGAGNEMEGSGNNFGATKEVGEPAHDGHPGGASVWFGWTAPRSQSVFVQFCPDGWAGRLGIYRGDAVGQLTPVAASHVIAGDFSCGEAWFPAISSVTYRFAVDGSNGGAGPDEGNFSLRVSATPLNPPANDAFAAAEPLKPESWNHFAGNTGEATREVGEPGRGGDLAGASVWYRWTAPESRPIRIYPCRAGFRPAISVYAGSELAGLRLVSSPAPIEPGVPGECQVGGFGGVGFDAVAGQTYSIAFDSDDGSFGSFRALMLATPTLFVDVYPPGTYIYKLLRLRGNGIGIQFGSGGGPPGDTFLCKLDRQPFKPCRTPKKWHGLEAGRHRVAVVATDAAGNRDRTPAVRTFRMGAR